MEEPETRSCHFTLYYISFYTTSPVLDRFTLVFTHTQFSDTHRGHMEAHSKVFKFFYVSEPEQTDIQQTQNI